MTSATKLAHNSTFFVVVILVGLACPTRTQAQCPFSLGNTGAYASCGTGINPKGSAAYIDASVFTRTDGKTDVCAKINAVYLSTSSPYPTAGAVIDARGVLPPAATGLQVCTISPWAGTPPSGKWPPATILLPAGTIAIPSGWVLPNETRIVGENGGSSAAGTAGLTTIQACLTTTSGCPSSNFSGTMITMGNSVAINNCQSTGCIGIGVEDLWLDGKGLSVTGISNTFSTDLSYVRHVNLYQIIGVGLTVASTSQNSGPYTDVGFSLGTATAVANTVCAHITNVSTRGIHGLTCTGNVGTGTIPSNAVVLDASNNSIEDVEIQGFGNGVLIGQNDSAQNDALLNISGGTNVSNVISITNVSGKTVSDISIVGVTNGNGSAKTIQDARTSPATTISAPTVGLYVLGDPVDSSGSPIGYTRFTTAVGVPTWAVGGSTPSPTTGCTVGSLYSNAQGSGTNKTWFVCLPKNKCTPNTATCWTPIG